MKYFEVLSGVDTKFPTFVGRPTPGCVSPVYDVLREFGMAVDEFVMKANRLFEDCCVNKVPEGYPKLRSSKKKLLGDTLETDPMDDFACCVASCIS